ncbi:MAG: hypothetical protein WKG00_23685 [Polyangiaceae bacterium]
MKVAIVGLGLVTPLARTATEHAFFLRAGVIGPPRAPFLLADDEQLPVRVTPWLGARAPMAERLAALARPAISEALAPLAASGAGPLAGFHLCTTERRAGAGGALEDALTPVARMPRAARVTGEAGAFQALEAESRALERDPQRLSVVLAVDSFVSIEALCERLDRAPSPWAAEARPPAEGAAALLVTSPARARELRLDVMATIDHVTVFRDAATDDNDEPAEAKLMTQALRRAPATRPWRFAFGPVSSGGLRSTEWHLATARTATRFGRECEMRSIEAEVGALGAATGAADIALGAAMLRHDAMVMDASHPATFVAWAMSGDGTRGLAALEVIGK